VSRTTENLHLVALEKTEHARRIALLQWPSWIQGGPSRESACLGTNWVDTIHGGAQGCNTPASGVFLGGNGSPRLRARGRAPRVAIPHISRNEYSFAIALR
jgi:hypothetical protein